MTASNVIAGSLMIFVIVMSGCGVSDNKESENTGQQVSSEKDSTVTSEQKLEIKSEPEPEPEPEYESTELNVIHDALIAFEESIETRTINRHYSECIFTSKGSFSIGTQEAVRDDDGEFCFEGKSRLNGYFIIPRMCWVDTIREAERVMIEDYKAGRGIAIAPSFQEVKQLDKRK